MGNEVGIDKLVPLGPRIVVEVCGLQDKWGNVHIPENAKQKLIKCKVVSLGTDARCSEFDIGDIVLIQWFTGAPVDILDINIKNDAYKIVAPHEIVGRWRE